MGISAKVLSLELKFLEAHGLVTRKVLVDEFPFVMEYVQTDYSDSLGCCMDTHIKLGMGHRESITGKIGGIIKLRAIQNL